MPHNHHGHRHLPRNPDFWSDVGDKFKNLNPFASDEDDSGTTNGARSTVIRTVYQTVTDGANAAAASSSSSTKLIVAESPLPTRTRSTTSVKSAETTVARAGAPVVKSAEASSTTNADLTSSLPSVIEEPLSESIPTTLAIATDAPTFAKSTRTAAATADNASLVSTPSASATSASEESTSTGTSGAAKAGIAIGVLAGALVVFLLVFFLFNRRKRQLEQQRLSDEDEKPFGAATMGRNPRAPRISLRPVTQFLPNLNLDKRASKGPNATMNANLAPAAAMGARAPGQTAWGERSLTNQGANPANNPFGAQAERINGPIPEESVTSLSLNEKPLPAVADAAPVTANAPATAGADGAANGIAITTGAVAAAGAASLAVGGALTRKASTRKDGPKALDLTLPPPPAPLTPVPASPAGTTFSADTAGPGHQSTGSTGSAAIAAAGGPANTTVHRVQLDFKPTLEDELELRAGQLVRLLHEYDDGWALCIRLDRSQQGVVPRTCLSARPVKPRPPQNQGPPRGPPMGPGAQRGPGPNFPPGQRPMTPQGGPHGGPHGGPPYPRPESPARSMGPGPRPASPAGSGPMGPGGRSQSPGPRYQGPPGQRPQSPGGMGHKQGPQGPTRIPQPSRMNPGGPMPQSRPGPPVGPVGRKPVPGQAV
ncbi:hypothetical protein EsH8_IX_000250 [Colletotrichum jinshuiense]